MFYNVLQCFVKTDRQTDLGIKALNRSLKKRLCPPLITKISYIRHKKNYKYMAFLLKLELGKTTNFVQEQDEGSSSSEICVKTNTKTGLDIGHYLRLILHLFCF